MLLNLLLRLLLAGRFQATSTKEHLYIDYERLTAVLHVGSMIFIDDGVMSFKVTEINGSELTAEVINCWSLLSRFSLFLLFLLFLVLR